MKKQFLSIDLPLAQEYAVVVTAKEVIGLIETLPPKELDQVIEHIHEIEELNIGHSIVSRAVFVGMKQAVREMKHLLSS